MDELQECYAEVTGAFGILGPAYDDQGHRGADFDRDARQSILAYDDMVVASVPEWSSGIGWTVGLERVNIGGFAGFAHIYGLVGGLGTEIPKGEPIALVAGWGDDPGRLWFGPHIHTTESWESAYAAAAGIRPLTDPVPTINKAIGATTAGGGSSIIIPEGTDIDMSIIIIATSDDSAGLFRKGHAFVDNGTEPLVLLGGAEVGAFDYWAGKGVPYRRAEWPATKIREVINYRGYRPFNGATGRTDYSRVAYA